MFDWIRRQFGAQQKTVFAPSKQPLYSEEAYYRMLQYFAAVPDPDELLKQSGIRREQLRLLELDDEVSGRLEDRIAALVATPWGIEDNETTAGKFIHDQLEPHIESIDRATISAAAYGYSMMEVVYSRLPGGRTGISSVEEKPLEWFDYSADDYWWHSHPDDGSGDYRGIPCDPRKFFPIVRNPTTRNPYGESLLSRLWFPVTWRREGWGLWMNFLETFGTPIVAANVRNYKGFVEAMQKQGVRSVIAWQGEDTDKISTIQPATSGEFERMENALTKRIQKLILGNTMTTDGGQYGSRASGEVGLQVEDARRFADIRMGSKAIQRLIDVLCNLNGFPSIKFERKDETGLEEARANRDKNLAPVLQSSGLKFSQGYFIDNYALSEDDLEAAVISQPTGIMASASAKPTIVHLAADPQTSPQDSIDSIANDALSTAPVNPIDPELIRNAVMAASNKHDLERRLLAIFESSDSRSPEFQDVLERAHFAAQVIGYVAAEEHQA